MLTTWLHTVHFSPHSLPLLLQCQACKPSLGSEQHRHHVSDHGWLAGDCSDSPLQGGFLWGQLQLVWHLSQDLHRVRERFLSFLTSALFRIGAIRELFPHEKLCITCFLFSSAEHLNSCSELSLSWKGNVKKNPNEIGCEWHNPWRSVSNKWDVTYSMHAEQQLRGSCQMRMNATRHQIPSSSCSQNSATHISSDVQNNHNGRI